MLTVSDTDNLDKTTVDKKEFCLKDDTVLKISQIGNILKRSNVKAQNAT